MVDGRDNAWRSRAPRPHAHGNTARQVMDGLRTEVRGHAWTARTSQTTLQQPTTSTTSVRQLLGATDAQTACHATSSTAPAHQPLGSVRQRHPQEHRLKRPTESSNRTQHAKGRIGDCLGPVKKQDGMSQRGCMSHGIVCTVDRTLTSVAIATMIGRNCRLCSFQATQDVFKKPNNLFSLRTALKDSTLGQRPVTTNRQPPAANHQPLFETVSVVLCLAKSKSAGSLCNSWCHTEIQLYIGTDLRVCRVPASMYVEH